jgi:hypothetical protein
LCREIASIAGSVEASVSVGSKPGFMSMSGAVKCGRRSRETSVMFGWNAVTTLAADGVFSGRDGAKGRKKKLLVERKTKVSFTTIRSGGEKM